MNDPKIQHAFSIRLLKLNEARPCRCKSCPRQIKKHYMLKDTHECEKYKQLHGDFIDQLSVMDLLMNEGPNSKKIILSGKKFKKYDF